MEKYVPFVLCQYIVWLWDFCFQKVRDFRNSEILNIHGLKINKKINSQKLRLVNLIPKF